jgi:hypothetical protein
MSGFRLFCTIGCSLFVFTIAILKWDIAEIDWLVFNFFNDNIVIFFEEDDVATS